MPRITIAATTTDEQIMAPVEAAKAELAQAASEALTTEVMVGARLVALAQNVASADAVSHVAYQYRSVLQRDGDPADFLLGLLVHGADDEWSGRKNDSKRQSHDAVRAFVRDQHDALRYGA